MRLSVEKRKFDFDVKFTSEEEANLKEVITLLNEIYDKIENESCKRITFNGREIYDLDELGSALNVLEELYRIDPSTRITIE